MCSYHPMFGSFAASPAGHTADINDIKAYIRNRTSFVQNTQLRAEAITNMSNEGTYVYSADLDFMLEEFRVDWWPQGASRKFPTATSKEKAHCQPFVSTMLRLFVSGKVSVEGRKKSDTVEVNSIPNPDAFTQITLGNRSPDITMYDGMSKVGISAMTQVGEVKGGGEGEFPPDEAGQLTDSLARTMNKQPQRKRMMGFLTDGRRFLFVECVRCGGGYQYHHSSIFVGQNGWQVREANSFSFDCMCNRARFHCLQIVFGLMQADPSQLGYERILVPGYDVGDLLGVGSFSTVFQAERNSETPSAIRKNVPAADLPAGFSVHKVEGDGNCFFHAIAHQLQTNGLTQEGGEVYTHETLTELALNRVNADPRFRLIMSDNEIIELSDLEGWVDYGALAAMAEALNMRLIVFGSAEGQVIIGADGQLGSEEVGHATLRIVYNGIDHYDSAVVNEESDGSSTNESGAEEKVGEKRAYNFRVRDEPERTDRSAKRAKSGELLAKSGKRLKGDDRGELPVAVKIFESKNRKMRDHEQAILKKLQWYNNVPTVIKVLNVCHRPAIIVSPAGSKVLPVKGGVRANVTDFVKLLQVLENAHKAHICHRDVKPQNIFKDDHGRVILNDWSSAAAMKKNARWAGTPFYYEKCGEYHTPQAADDLVALVRSVYTMYTNTVPVEETTSRDINRSPLWRAALQHARDLNYDQLRTFFNNL